MRILIIEDETRIVELICKGLTRAGFAVDSVGRKTDADEALATLPYDAAILDLGLPDCDGIEIIEGLRAEGNQIPIMVLTARDAVEDRVRGLNAGADDYVVKPFDISEIIARTKALLRRPGGALGTILTAGNLVFDTVGRDVRVRGQTMALPRRESSILEHLLRRMGRVVPRTVLEDKLYGIDDVLESNAIPVHIHHLRRKMMDAGATPQIHTVRGIGYILIEPRA